jgi:hypothetical protein
MSDLTESDSDSDSDSSDRDSGSDSDSSSDESDSSSDESDSSSDCDTPFGLEECQDPRVASNVNAVYGTVMPLQGDHRMNEYCLQIQCWSHKRWREQADRGLILLVNGKPYSASPACAAGRVMSFSQKNNSIISRVVAVIAVRAFYTIHGTQKSHLLNYFVDLEDNTIFTEMPITVVDHGLAPKADFKKAYALVQKMVLEPMLKALLQVKKDADTAVVKVAKFVAAEKKEKEENILKVVASEKKKKVHFEEDKKKTIEEGAKEGAKEGGLEGEQVGLEGEQVLEVGKEVRAKEDQKKRAKKEKAKKIEKAKKKRKEVPTTQVHTHTPAPTSRSHVFLCSLLTRKTSVVESQGKRTGQG